MCPGPGHRATGSRARATAPPPGGRGGGGRLLAKSGPQQRAHDWGPANPMVSSKMRSAAAPHSGGARAVSGPKRRPSHAQMASPYSSRTDTELPRYPPPPRPAPECTPEDRPRARPRHVSNAPPPVTPQKEKGGGVNTRTCPPPHRHTSVDATGQHPPGPCPPQHRAQPPGAEPPPPDLNVQIELGDLQRAGVCHELPMLPSLVVAPRESESADTATGHACGMGQGGHVRGGGGCSRREGASEAAPEAGRRAVGGGCQSGWGRLLSVTNAVEAGVRGTAAGRRLGALEPSTPITELRSTKFGGPKTGPRGGPGRGSLIPRHRPPHNDPPTS